MNNNAYHQKNYYNNKFCFNLKNNNCSNINAINNNMNNNNKINNNFNNNNNYNNFNNNNINGNNINNINNKISCFYLLSHNHSNIEEEGSTIFKENNNNIIYSKDEPLNIKEKNIIQNSNNTECITFTAFNKKGGQPIIAWTTKKENNTINIQNLSNEEKNKKNAHEYPIDSLYYFHNENLEEDNDFIVSLSKMDQEIIKIWKIKINELDLECTKAILKNHINNNIGSFCIFNNAQFCNKYSYFFFYDEIITKYPGSNDINYYKLDISFNANKTIGRIENSENIKFLDTFYDKNKNTLYLLSSNDTQVNLIVNPLSSTYIKRNFEHKNKIKNHMAFIVKINDKLELFISDENSINIWNINNNDNPIKTINISLNNNNNTFIYDICLWNYNYLLVSTNIDFQLININNNQTKILDKCNGKSKIRKIITPNNHSSIVGIDENNNLCLWSKSKSK
jgi:hypothetical protein